MPDPSTLSAPTLNPTLSLLELSVPVIAWVVRYNAGEFDPPPPLPSPDGGRELALLLRHPASERIGYHRADDDLLFAIKVTHEGVPWADAAQGAGLDLALAEAAWRRAVRLGVVIDAPGG